SAPAGGGDPRRGGEPRGHVARPAEPRREGGRRRRSAPRRSRRPVHRGAGRSGGNRARHGGDPAQRTPRAVVVRVGKTDVEAREEALNGRQIVGATAAAVVATAVRPALAHNFSVPHQLVLTSSTAALGHSYWESRFETHLGPAYAGTAKELILQDHTPSDAHLDSIISPTLFSLRTNRRLFRGMVRLTE